MFSLWLKGDFARRTRGSRRFAIELQSPLLMRFSRSEASIIGVIDAPLFSDSLPRGLSRAFG